MGTRIIPGIKLYEFFLSKGYTNSYVESSIVALKPPNGFEVGYIPLSIYYSWDYPEQCLEYILEREGFTLEEFYSWLDKNG